MPAKGKASSASQSSATIGFEAKLWLAADKLRNNMEVAEPNEARQPARQGRPNGLKKIISTYHAWRGDGLAQSRGAAEKKKDSENLRASASLREYSDIPGFCKSAIPTPDIARRFDELTSPVMAKIKATSTESRTLATLRDTLLPKLLSGEITPAN
jgi:hypothetical protein